MSCFRNNFSASVRLSQQSPLGSLSAPAVSPVPGNSSARSSDCPYPYNLPGTEAFRPPAPQNSPRRTLRPAVICIPDQGKKISLTAKALFSVTSAHIQLIRKWSDADKGCHPLPLDAMIADGSRSSPAGSDSAGQYYIFLKYSEEFLWITENSGTAGAITLLTPV